MTGPVAIYAMAERHRIAEKAVPKVRRELYRLGCLADIQVIPEEGTVRLRYREKSLLANPSDVLLVLSEKETGIAIDRLWDTLKLELSELQSDTLLRLMMMVVTLSLLFALLCVFC